MQLKFMCDKSRKEKCQGMTLQVFRLVVLLHTAAAATSAVTSTCFYFSSYSASWYYSVFAPFSYLEMLQQGLQRERKRNRCQAQFNSILMYLMCSFATARQTQQDHSNRRWVGFWDSYRGSGNPVSNGSYCTKYSDFGRIESWQIGEQTHQIEH